MHRQPPARVCFGPFDLDLRAGELCRNGRSIVLHQQPFQVLLMLVELDGEIATREEIKKKLWPNDTVVEFDHSINAAIRKLRRELEDSADAPKYIQTVARRGYRLLVPVTWIEARVPGNPPALTDATSAVVACIPVNTKAGIGDLAGKTVSHYRVLDIIGGGGMGLVYRAEDLKLGRAVALKFLPEEMGGDPRALERFEREARAVSVLSHPNICPIFEFDDYEGQPFIVMELLRGLTLREHIAAGRFRLSDPAGLDIAIQIAAGLEAAHEKGIIHRDIKPANIFITEKSVAKILDFGVAKILQAAAPHELDEGLGETDAGSQKSVLPNVTRTGLKLGTAGYMSPEQVRGEALDARTDIFSFGLVLYEMATGERAFTGETEAMLHAAIVNCEPEPLRERAPEVSPDLSIIVEKCLEKEREERFQSAKEVRAALSDWQHDLSPTGPWLTDEPESHSPRRKYWLAAITFAAVLFAVVGGVLYRRAQPTTKLTDQDTIVLADFENKTGDPVFDDSLSTALRIGLEQTPFLNLLAPDKVTRVMKQLGHTVREPFTYEKAKKVCSKTNSAAVITGSIVDAGNQYQITAKAIDCRTSEAIANSTAVAQTRDVVVRVLGEVATELRRRMGEPRQTLRQFDQPLQIATTTSLEALHAFSLATTPGRQSEQEALLGLQSAVELDRNFALAYYFLDEAYARTYQIPSAVEAGKSAYDLRARMTQKQRLREEAAYSWGHAGQWDDAIRAFERWAATYPHDYEPRIGLCSLFLVTQQPERAAEEARAAMVLDPDASDPVDYLLSTELHLNRLAEARAVYEAHSYQLDRRDMREVPYEIGFLQHDAAFMQEQLNWLKDQPGSQDWFFILQAETEAFYGRFRRASQLVQAGVKAAIGDNRSQAATLWILQHAWRESEVGNFKTAQELTKSVLKLPSNNLSEYDLTFAAVILARCGDVKAANAVLQQLSERFSGPAFTEEVEIPNVQAAIQLQLGQPIAAIASLEILKRKGHELGGASLISDGYAGYLRGLAYMSASQPLRAAAEFQNIIDNPAEVTDHITGPLAHLQIARAQAMMDDKQGARKSYEDFLTLWKDADPDIPIYKQAKAEYAKLR